MWNEPAIEEPYIEPVIEEPWNGAEIHGQYIVHILNISREIPADTLCNYSLPFGQGDMSRWGVPAMGKFVQDTKISLQCLDTLWGLRGGKGQNDI